jgi:predicted MFS family arabinose efflux permease
MLRELITIAMLARLLQSRTVRRVLLIILAALFIVSMIYTANLFLTLSERTSQRYEHTHSPR